MLVSTEVQPDPYNGLVTLQPRWLRLPATIKYSGIGRSRFCELIAEGKIRSYCIKAYKSAQRGIPVVDRQAIDEFMLSLES
jgi:hypothetical protein